MPAIRKDSGKSVKERNAVCGLAVDGQAHVCHGHELVLQVGSGRFQKNREVGKTKVTRGPAGLLAKGLFLIAHIPRHWPTYREQSSQFPQSPSVANFPIADDTLGIVIHRQVRFPQL